MWLVVLLAGLIGLYLAYINVSMPKVMAYAATRLTPRLLDTLTAKFSKPLVPSKVSPVRHRQSLSMEPLPMVKSRPIAVNDIYIPSDLDG